MSKRTGSYWEEFQRQKLRQSTPVELSRLMTDRTAYIAFLEVQLERMTSVCQTVQGFGERCDGLQGQVNEFEDKLANMTRLLKLSQSVSDQQEEENQRIHDSLKARSRKQEEIFKTVMDELAKTEKRFDVFENAFVKMVDHRAQEASDQIHAVDTRINTVNEARELACTRLSNMIGRQETYFNSQLETVEKRLSESVVEHARELVRETNAGHHRDLTVLVDRVDADREMNIRFETETNKAVARLGHELEELRGTLKEKDGAIAELKNEVQSLRAALQKCEGAQTAGQDEVGSRLKVMEATATRLHEDTVAKFDGQHHKLHSEVDGLRTAVDEVGAWLREELETRSKATETALGNLGQRSNDLEETTERQASVQSALSKEVRAAVDKMEDVHRALQDQMAQRNRLDDIRIEDIKEEITNSVGDRFKDAQTMMEDAITSRLDVMHNEARQNTELEEKTFKALEATLRTRIEECFDRISMMSRQYSKALESITETNARSERLERLVQIRLSESRAVEHAVLADHLKEKERSLSPPRSPLRKTALEATVGELESLVKVMERNSPTRPRARVIEQDDFDSLVGRGRTGAKTARSRSASAGRSRSKSTEGRAGPSKKSVTAHSCVGGASTKARPAMIPPAKKKQLQAKKDLWYSEPGSYEDDVRKEQRKNKLKQLYRELKMLEKEEESSG